MNDCIVVDAERCIGCRTCEAACALAHAPLFAAGRGEFAPRLSIRRLDGLSAPVMCRQCENAPCVTSCPTGALYSDREGVHSNPALCIACKSCMIACPFGCITISQAQGAGVPSVIRCDLCAEREGGPTCACVEACPTRALEKRGAAELEQRTERRIQQTAAGCFIFRL